MAVIDSKYREHLGQDLYLFDSLFNEQTYAYVRKLLKETIPTKDDISLTLQRCSELIMSLLLLDGAVSMMQQNQVTFYRRHLG